MRAWQAWFWWRGSQCLVWLLVALGLGLLLWGPQDAGPRWWWPFGRPAPAAVAVPAGGWTAVAKAVRPAVVHVAARRPARTPGEEAPFPPDPSVRPLPDPAPLLPRERSLGSGVLVSGDGYVLTNHHVVEGARDIRVTLADRRAFQARLIGADPRTDLAVLRLPGTGYPVVPLGDSGRVEVGEVVLAVGNPFGLNQTVTLGIVSAVGRADVGLADYEDFIQTDAAINPGNSGGALVNARGELIGINTAILSESGGFTGIGFAVPVNMARQVMDQLVRRGRVTRGYLGATVQELTPALARGLGLGQARGILVADVVPDGPAARAGLRRGDVIVGVDGQSVEDPGHLRNRVAAAAPGSRLRLTVAREGREVGLEAVVAELPDRPAPPAPARPEPDPLGLAVADLTPDAARRLGLPPGTPGAVVAEVHPGGLAAEAGLRPGDVLLEVNRRPVRSARDVVRAVEAAGSGDLALLVSRQGRTAYLAVEREG